MNSAPAAFLLDPAAVDTPALLVDLDRLEANVAGMAAIAREGGVALRPHAKTHKTPQIARMQLAAGAVGLTVATLGEAEAFADAGASDLLVAYPIIGERALARLLRLAERVRITVALDDAEVARALGRAAAALGLTVGVLVEVDTGGRRCGLATAQAIVALARAVADTPGLEFTGLLTHEGHGYGAPDAERLVEVSQVAAARMVESAEAVRAAGLPVATISLGSTPTARWAARTPGVTEIRPGTYAFGDYNQVRLGVASAESCAARVLARVISHPVADRAVVDAGSKTLSSDRRMVRHDPDVFGLLPRHPGWRLVRLSEEHGVLERSDPAAPELRVGDWVDLLPNHICPVVNLAESLTIVRGGQVVDTWPVAARGHPR